VQEAGEQAESEAGDGEGTAAARSERASRLAQRARASISQVRSAAGARVGTLAHDLQDRGQRVGSRMEETFQENPLLIGAAVLAAGALLGALIPSTRREDALMGKTRDGLVRQAQTFAQDTLEKAEDVVRRLDDDSTSAAGVNGNRPSGSRRRGPTSGSPSTPR
jgi:hypothetical protein